MKSQVSREVLLKFLVGHDSLYQFPDLLKLLKSKSFVNTIVCSVPSSIFVNTSQNDTFVGNTPTCNAFSFVTWHFRVGHSSANAMKNVVQIYKFLAVNKSVSNFYSHYCFGKSHRFPSSVLLTIYSSLFELIFTDLWGPAPFLSSSGYRYYVTFVDAHTSLSSSRLWLILGLISL